MQKKIKRTNMASVARRQIIGGGAHKLMTAAARRGPVQDFRWEQLMRSYKLW